MSKRTFLGLFRPIAMSILAKSYLVLPMYTLMFYCQCILSCFTMSLGIHVRETNYAHIFSTQQSPTCSIIWGQWSFLCFWCTCCSIAIILHVLVLPNLGHFIKLIISYNSIFIIVCFQTFLCCTEDNVNHSALNCTLFPTMWVF